jgi:hypothetical protein
MTPRHVLADDLRHAGGMERVPDAQIELELQALLPLVERARNRRLQQVRGHLLDDAVDPLQEAEQLRHESAMADTDVHGPEDREAGSEPVLPPHSGRGAACGRPSGDVNEPLERVNRGKGHTAWASVCERRYLGP